MLILVNELTPPQMLAKIPQISDEEAPKASQDDEIVATADIVSLNDPYSLVRIVIPIKSITCTHYQCFDAESYLRYSKDIAYWQCSVCFSNIEFESLRIDKLFSKMLEESAPDVDNITILPNGEWSSKPKAKKSLSQELSKSFSELIDLVDLASAPSKRATLTPHSTISNPFILD